MLRLRSTALLLALFLAIAPRARAGDVAEAEALFRQGRSLMESGDYADACPKLAESYSQDQATGTLLALAMCREHLGQLASAWANYGQVVARAKREGRADREQAAREKMLALEPRLSHLTIQVDATTAALQGLVIKRDGEPVGKGAWGAAVPLDPGEHLVEAAAPNRTPFSVKLVIAGEHDTQTVRVPELAPAPAAAPAALSAAPAAGTTQADQAARRSGPPLRTIGLAVGGAGVVGLVVGTVFGLHAKSLNNASNADGHCNADNQCDAVGGGKRDDARSAATISTVAFIAGGVLTATGVTLYLLGGPKHAKTTAGSLELTPAVGQRSAGLCARGSF